MTNSLHFAIEFVNRLGVAYWQFASAMFWQVAVVIAWICLLDLFVLRRVRASVRYAVWCLVLVKLVLPTTLPGPLSAVNSNLTNQPAVTQVLRWSSPPLRPLHVNVVPELPTPQNEFDPIEPTATLNQFVKAAEAVVTRTNPTLNAFGWLFMGCTAVASLLMVLFARQAWLVHRLVANSTPASDELSPVLGDVLKTLKMNSNRVQIRVTRQISGPAICGFWKGTILIPQDLVTRMDREQLSLVMTHELTHWRRGDLQINCLQSLLQIFYFYHPLIWFANAMIRRIREYVADEETLLTSNVSIEQYANTLVLAADLSRRTRGARLALMGVVRSQSALSNRVRRMLDGTLPKTARLGGIGLATVVLLGLVLLPMGTRTGQATAQEKKADSSKVEEPAVELDVELTIDDVEAMKFPQSPPFEELIELEFEASGRTNELISESGLPLEDQKGLEEVAADELAGIVLDELTGKPIADAKVDVWHWYPGNETVRTTKDSFV